MRALDMYRAREMGPNSQVAQEFRADHSQEVDIHFLGVFDTVGALGLPVRFWHRWKRPKYGFHDLELSKIVKHAYQAVAVDERRLIFIPTLWDGQPKEGQTIEQVWFAGCHRDVGGGESPSGLSDQTLLWMAEKAFDHGLGLDDRYLQGIAVPDPLGQLHQSRKSFYRLWRPFTREIGAWQPNTEALHSSVITRTQEAAPPYRPGNVERYLGKPNHQISGAIEESDDETPAPDA